MSKRKFDVCVIGGAGHVGLPLAAVFADQGLDTLIYDINKESLATLSQGIVPFIDDGAEELLRSSLASGKLTLSSQPERIAEARHLILTIGTPVDEFHNPVLSSVRNCIDYLLPYLDDEQTLILRSTVYPGTTDWLHDYMGKHGKNCKVAFCPERVVQGQSISELKKLPQLVSGTTPEALEAASQLFHTIAPELVVLKPIEAEFAKLFNNAYRYIEFAITNQFYMIADSAGVDYFNVLKGMKQNYPRAMNIPSPGFASGPCLFKDTMQLAAFSNNQFSIGNSAMLVNEGLVLYVANEIKKNYSLDKLTVGILGMAFKAEIDDIRSSLSYKMKKVLQFNCSRVLTTDPFVKNDPDLVSLERAVDESDLLILCVPHKAYKELDTRGKPVIDIWNHIVPGRDAPEAVAAKQATPTHTSVSSI